MVQGKPLKTRDYVIGFEPANCHALAGKRCAKKERRNLYPPEKPGNFMSGYGLRTRTKGRGYQSWGRGCPRSWPLPASGPTWKIYSTGRGRTPI
ncbi:MAG: hypothetical protein LBF78_08915 [Treponema sp.]|nr:hypothetical protein [Treponema sp.]